MAADENLATTEMDDATDELLEGGDERQKLDLQVQVESPSSCQRHITVTISQEDIERYFDQEFSKIMPEAQVPGFRPGRAPRKLVENKFRHQISDQVKGTLLLHSMEQVSKEQEFSAIGEPDFDLDAVELPDEGPMTFEFDLEVRPDFDVPQWKGLKLERLVYDFTRDDVDRHLAKVLKRYAEIAPFDGPAEAGDFAQVNITFKHNGEVLSRLEEQLVAIRPTLSFHDGKLEKFDELMIGAKEEDHRSGKVTLTADAPNEALRGEEVDVEVEVLEIKRLELPEMTDEFLSRIGDFESEGDLRDLVQSELERQLEYRRQQSLREQITEQLIADADWDLPPELLKRQSRRELERAILELQSSGFSEDDIRAHINSIKQNSQQATAKALKEHFIFERIAEMEEVTETEEDYELEILRIASQSNESPRRVRAKLEKRGQMDALRNQVIERKVVGMITDEAKFTDKPYQPEEEEVEAVDFTISGNESAEEIPSAKPGGEHAAPGSQQNRVVR